MRRREAVGSPRPTRLIGAGEPLDLLLRHAGRALAWWGPHRQIRGGLLCEDGPLLALPELVAVATVPGSPLLWLASRSAPGAQAGLQLWRFDGQRLNALRPIRASGIHLGSHWMLAWRGAEAFAAELETGDPVELPLGAREARARPWPEEPGASWCAGKTLVQQRGRDAPQAVGVASEALLGLRVGPRGAALTWGRKDTWAHAPGHGLVPLAAECAPADGCAFSPDGEQALVQTPAGVSLVELRSGQPLDDRPQAVVAGWRCVEDPQGYRHRWLSHGEAAPPPRGGDEPSSGLLPAEVLALGLPMDGARPSPEGGWLCWQAEGLQLELKARPSTAGRRSG